MTLSGPMRCSLGPIALVIAVSASAQDIHTSSWHEVFAHGFRDIGALAAAERIRTDSAPSLLEGMYGRCDIGSPDVVLLVGQPNYSRGEQSWEPSFGAEQDSTLSARGREVAAPDRPDSLAVRVALSVCDRGGTPYGIIAEADDRFILVTLPDRPWLGLVWVFARSPEGVPSGLRWSPVLRRLETISSARARFRSLRWSQRTVTAVLSGSLRIGMTADMVHEAWGMPRSVNRTMTAAGQSEQWEYPWGYVYLDNGRVTAVQT